MASKRKNVAKGRTAVTPIQEGSERIATNKANLPGTIVKWFGGLLSAMLITYFGALVTDLGKPNLEFVDTELPKSFIKKGVVKDGALHGVLVVEPLIRNTSPFPGNVERGDLIPLNPTTKGTTLTVNFIDKQRLYWRQQRRVQIRMVAAIPLTDAATRDDPEFRLQLYDNRGQQIGPEPYNFKVVSRHRSPIVPGDRQQATLAGTVRASPTADP